MGEQRRRENRNKTATNPEPVSRKSRGNFPGCLRRRRSKPSSASAGYNSGYFPGLESCFLMAVFTFKINVLVWKWYDETIVNEATSFELGTVLLFICNTVVIFKFAFGPEKFPGLSRNGCFSGHKQFFLIAINIAGRSAFNRKWMWFGPLPSK